MKIDEAEMQRLQAAAAKFLADTGLEGLDRHTSIRQWLVAFAYQELDIAKRTPRWVPSPRNVGLGS